MIAEGWVTSELASLIKKSRVLPFFDVRHSLEVYLLAAQASPSRVLDELTQVTAAFRLGRVSLRRLAR